jgi:uncharacterized protein
MSNLLTANMVYRKLANLPQLTFEVTDACNLRCKYCGYGEFYDDYDKRENRMMSVDAALQLINYLAALWNSEQNASAKRIYRPKDIHPVSKQLYRP